jgi:hypothetical protein
MELDSDIFIKVNQSYLINKYFIKVIDKRKKTVSLNGEEIIPFTITVSSFLDLIRQNVIPFLLANVWLSLI